MLVTDAIEAYLHEITVNQLKSITTVDTYTTYLKQYQAYLEANNITDITLVTTEVILDYIDVCRQRLHPNTVAHLISIIRNFHNYLTIQFNLSYNPAIKIKAIKPSKHLPLFFQPEELDIFFKSFDLTVEQDIFHCALFELMYATGLRVSEVAALTFQQLNTSNMMVKIIGKGNKERIIPIAEYSLNILNNYLEIRKRWDVNKRRTVFIKKNGQPITRNYIWHVLKKQLTKAQLNPKLTPHSFRHTFATDLLSGSADLRVVQELLGHSDVATTQLYTHVSSQKLITAYDQFHPKSNNFKEPKK